MPTDAQTKTYCNFTNLSRVETNICEKNSLIIETVSNERNYEYTSVPIENRPCNTDDKTSINVHDVMCFSFYSYLNYS